ncbi:MAG: DUF1934 domain-containing protein [Cellulosilyticaceae bacterium]
MDTIKLKIINTQKYETHEDTSEDIVEGIVAIKGESTYITFKQEDLNFKTTVTTLIKIKKGIMTVKRQGSIQSGLTFDILKPQETLYSTPMGNMNIQVETHELENRITAEDVYLRVRYSISMQGNKTSENIYFVQNL